MNFINNDEVAKRLQSLKTNGQSARQIAIGASIDASQYSKIEKGKLPITPSILDKLVNTYGWDKNFILYGIGVPRGTPDAEKAFTIKTDIDTFIGERTEISNAIEAAVRVLKVKLVEMEARVTKRPFSSVSLEFDRLMQDELKQIEADMKKKYS